jgi:uncharacterized sulfatase
MIRLFLLTLMAAGLNGAAFAAKPNIVLIISDDHGWKDYGLLGSPHAKTPNIDRLMAESLVYTRGYTMPVCSPSLACLLTGRLPHRHGITGNDLAKPPVVPKGQKVPRDPLAKQLLGNPVILPKALTDAGYLTFQSGKLWNTTFREVGFTHGMTDTAGRHGDKGLTIGRQGMKPITDFLDEAKQQQKPFFIWYAPMMPHTPHNPPAELLAKYRGKGLTPAGEKYFAMVEWFDRTCGELNQALKDRGQADETAIVYLADNGWDAQYGHDRNRAKLSPYELGIRTPVFVKWPGKVPAMKDDETPASVVDVAPTILSIAGIQSSDGMDGRVLFDREAMKARTSVHVEAFTHDIADLKTPEASLVARVVIHGRYKLIVPGSAKPDRPFAGAPKDVELFDVMADPDETTNLASGKPAEVRRLRELLNATWNLP